MAIKVISDDPIQALVNIHALKSEKKTRASKSHNSAESRN